MVSFDKSYDALMLWEDSHPTSGLVTQDAGGLTKYGISQHAYPSLDIASLTQDEAKAITRRDYWKFDSVPYQAVATKLLDISFNLGEGTMCLYLSLVLKVHGTATIYSPRWFDTYGPDIGNHDVDSLLNSLRVLQLNHYIEAYKGYQHIPANTIKRALA